MKNTSIQLLLSIVAKWDMEMKQMDVKTMFLHRDLEEDIYISQPHGFIETSKGNLVCRLKKSLWGRLVRRTVMDWTKSWFCLGLARIGLSWIKY
ncbi:unnamed protein product [Prunus armeniaca]